MQDVVRLDAKLYELKASVIEMNTVIICRLSLAWKTKLYATVDPGTSPVILELWSRDTRLESQKIYLTCPDVGLLSREARYSLDPFDP